MSDEQEWRTINWAIKYSVNKEGQIKRNNSRILGNTCSVTANNGRCVTLNLKKGRHLFHNLDAYGPPELINFSSFPGFNFLTDGVALQQLQDWSRPQAKLDATTKGANDGD